MSGSPPLRPPPRRRAARSPSTPVAASRSSAPSSSASKRPAASTSRAAQGTSARRGAPALGDAFFAQDAGALGAVGQAGLLARLDDGLLDRVDPAFRDPEGSWVGISGRGRTIAYTTQAAGPAP